MSAVREHHCGAWVYELAVPDGGGRVVLDAAADGGPWLPAPDGRTALYDEGEFGHREHSCVPDGQGTLL